MKKIFIWTGSWSEHKICAYQSTLMYNFFKENWYYLSKSPKNADIIVINGYPFEEFEEKVNLLTIYYYLKKYPKKEILLIWSIPAMMPYMKWINRINLVWIKDINKLDELFEHNISINNIVIDNIKFFIPLNLESLNIDSYWYKWKNIESKYIFTKEDLSINIENIKKLDFPIDKIKEYDSEKYNYLDDISGEYPIEICTWCWGKCSYCGIKNVSGFVKSKPLRDIINKIKRWLDLWYKNFHFIDEDSASYWIDIWLDFADLLNEVWKISWNFKIKIFYFEPWKLEQLYSKINKITWKKIVSFCVPLQTTSQRILQIMNRKYNIENVLNIVKNIKENNNILITTQVIYWFPTETYKEFTDNFSLISNFDKVWFYYYSDRKWTISSKLKWKIPRREMIKRMIYLWKFKEKYIDRVFDKNESLKQWVEVFKVREY